MAYGGLTQIKMAEQEQQFALRIFEKLAQEHPDVLEYGYDVGRCHSELARTAARGGRLELALEEYAKAIELMQQAGDRGYLRARILLLDSRINRAGVLARRGDHARATDEVEAVVRQGNPGSVQLYNAACVFSQASGVVYHDDKISPTDRDGLKARYGDRAMDYLRQAVANGYRNLSVIKPDPDLDSLRARQDFQKLLTELEADGAKK
jgi:tetratricopeptide (TPR) repeat protein